MKKEVFFPVGGGIAGASVYSTIGGIGVVGGFGGLGVGITGMTAAGAVIGSAFYGAAKGIEDGDATAFVATGLGAIGGIGASTIIGGIGVSFGGSAFGIGMCSMASMGGVFGLGVYGLAKMFSSSHTCEPIAETFNRIEDRISYEEAYNQALMELNPIFEELIWDQKFNALEIEDELEILKGQIRAKKKLDSTWNIHNNSYNFNQNNFEDEFINTEPESLRIELKENFAWKSIKVLTGHTGVINSLAIQDNIVASASEDHTIRLWNLETGKQLFSFFEPSVIDSLAINDQIIVAGNQSRKITSWNLQNKTLKHIFLRKSYDSFYRDIYNTDCHEGLIFSLVLSNDGKTLFSSSGDQTIRAWNTSTGEFKFALTGHTDLVLSLAITYSDRFLISGSADKTIRIWDLNNLSSKPQIITAHENWVTALAITLDEKYLASGSNDETVKLWDLSNLRQVYSLRHDAAVWSVAITPDGSTLASGSLDKTVKLWDLATGTISQTLQASTPVIFSDNGKYLITGNSRNQIVIWQRTSINNQLLIDSEITKQWWIVLGVEQNASTNEIKVAYHDLARQYHPDLNTSKEAEKIMQIINQAYYKAREANRDVDSDSQSLNKQCHA
ncbi:MAG: hypothetical protein RLZZ535_3611 [Cyanobacteriota bacterium]